MSGYILSILGIVVAGVLIDIIVPSGAINKYIRSIYAIFVVAVLVGPIMTLLNKANKFSFEYQDYQLNESILTYIYNKKTESFQDEIIKKLEEEGFSNVDILLNYSIEKDELIYTSCQVNLKNLVISKDKQHINKYEFIKNIIKENTNLKVEEIIINEWKK